MSNNVNNFQPRGKTKLVKGSIIAPENSGLRFVLSVANTAGKPEGNPLLPIFDKKWKKVREETKGWFANKTGAYKLGAINTIAVQSDTWVMNMLCQDDNFKVDVTGLEKCMKDVAASAKYERASVHVSTILTNDIPELMDLLNIYFINNGVSVYFYQET